MSKKGNKDKKDSDRHAVPSFHLRLPPRIYQQLLKLAERNDAYVTTEITIAIREKLEREGLWPAKPHET